MYIVSTAWRVRKLFVRVCGDIAPKRKKPPLSLTRASLYWWPGAESNHRHKDFQSSALPTELPGQEAGVYQNIPRLKSCCAARL